MNKQFRLTRDGINELTEERDTLVAQRKTIAEHIKSAREFGDLGENAEYSAARQEQDRNEARITEIEHILQNVEIIKAPRGARQVQLGSTVKLKGQGSKIKMFQVVGTMEADPLNGKISDESPIGQALLGKKEGDKVKIETLTDVTTYKIEHIS